MNIETFTARTIPTFEALASGHRACQGCAEILALRLALKAAGPNVIVANATGCMEVVTTPFPETSWKVPWIHVAFENASAVGSGIEGARKALARKGLIPDNDAKVLVVGGDGATYDIGLQSLSGALERGHDFTYLCLDNEAYMNTGIQRSSATPKGAWSMTSPVGAQASGKTMCKKDLVAIVAAHNIPYVATATPAFHLDLMNKVRRAIATPGPAFIHILSPCPTGWGIPVQRGIKMARLAVETNMYPLYEIVEGKYLLSRKIANPKPVGEYLGPQRRFRHLKAEDIAGIQADVDRDYARLEWLASKP
jgi:pyruvate ferredoxin oxidoreductase beta subunit